MHSTTRKGNVVIILCIMACILFSCATPKKMKPAGTPPSVQYIIGAEDILRVSVWKQPELTVSAPVRNDGKISIPLINDVQAAGLTPLQLQDEISKRLAKYIQEPTVSVVVEAINSMKIFVDGNVKTAGVYQIGRQINIVQAIALAGGFTDWANRKKVKVIRKVGSEDQMFEINYNDVIKGKKPEQNIAIYPGDTIIVP